jgi:mono/diheme cytochrome c family protein
MKLHQTFFAVVSALLFFTEVVCAQTQSTNVMATKPVYVPDTTHSTEALPDGVFAWDATTKSIDATNGQDFARFTFTFTNLAKGVEVSFTTNVTCATNITALTNTAFLWIKKITYITNVINNTNVVSATNSVPVPVAILNVHPSCGCTTAELPPVPWLIPPGSNGTIKLSVNLAGKSGTLFKTVNFTTEKGKKDLLLRINIAPPPPMPEMTEEQRAAAVATAKADRQAVFKGDCASCHLPKVEGKYGQPLFDALCAVCHQAKKRATMVPDLANLPVPTSEEFWRAWITAGKADSLMPAFAQSQGGPLNDLQIASLATYLNATYPSKVPQTTNAPAK